MDSSNFMTTSKWITFFTNAGLPASVAANYAILFTDHRIQMDMLLDLSKEYLYDMGIRVMGDVIAILKYAKEAHAQATKEKVFGERKVQATLPAPTRHSKPTLAGRILDYYTKPSPSTQLPTPTSTARIKESTRRPISQPSSQGLRSSSLSLKRRVETPKPAVAPKVRRVHPEDEGAYSIKMPSGTTERTRKILQAQAAKKSVFSRLGDNIVSSSTDVSKGKGISSSVFDRLGPSADGTGLGHQASSTDTSSPSRSEPVLQYRGVLKTAMGSKANKVPATNTITITRVIDNKKRVQLNQMPVQTITIKKTRRLVAPLSSRGTNQIGMPSTLLLKKSLAEATNEPSTSTRIKLTKGVQKVTTVKSRLGRKDPVQGGIGTFRSSASPQSSLVTGLTLRKQGLNSRRTVFERLGPAATVGQAT